jgi:pyridoxamine 5'-phosphate oxidase
MQDEEWKKQDPMKLFGAWLNEAKAAGTIKEPNAMCVATISEPCGLTNRIVLLKQVIDEGFIFYTNYHSPKGLSLDETGEAAATFYWDPLAKQIRITGTVTRTDRKTSEAYWNSRARGSQLSQFVSHQSAPVSSREELEALVAKAEEHFKDKPIPCPPHWGGYILTPKHIEFWQGMQSRLHNRFCFRRSSPDAFFWTCDRLYP